MQPVYPEVDGRAFAYLDDLLFDLFFYFGYRLFDAGRVDTAVGHQLVQRQPCDLAPHRIEAREDDRFGGVVDDNLDARGCLQRADVASFTADDTALDFVRVDVEHRYRIFDRRFGGDALDRLYDDLLRLLAGRHLGLFHHFVHIGERFGFGFGLHIFDQDIFRILAAQAADLLEPYVLLLDFAVDLLFLAVDPLQLGFELAAQGLLLFDLLVQLFLLLVQGAFELLGALFALRYLLVALVDDTIVFAFELDEFFFCLKDTFLLDHLTFGFRLLQYRAFAGHGLRDNEI